MTKAAAQKGAVPVSDDLFTDRLTGLPTPALLNAHLAQMVLLASRQTTTFAFVQFAIADRTALSPQAVLGTGEMLHQAGSRLRRTLRTSDILARGNFDHFSALLTTAPDAVGATAAVRKALITLNRPYTIAGKKVKVKFAAGIVLFPLHGKSVQQLTDRATRALEEAQKNGSGFAVFSSYEEEPGGSKLSFAGELARAIDNEEMRLYFQPKVDVKTRTVSGAEALIRWQHPRRGVVSPEEFVALAERSGLAKPLGLWVLRAALKQARTWHAKGITLPLGVNLSMQSVQDVQLPETIAALLAEYKLPPSALDIEVTETVAMTDPERTLDVLTRIAQLGVSISLDDFGSGYSSLAYLKHMPVQTLKIDKGFVQNLSHDSDDAALVSAAVELGHNLGMKVTAEGVEDKTTLDQLDVLGVDSAQGYLFSPPISARKFSNWLIRYKPFRASAAVKKRRKVLAPVAA